MEKDNSTYFTNGHIMAAFLLAPVPSLFLMTLFLVFPGIVDGNSDALGTLLFFSFITFFYGLPIVYALELVFGVPVFYVLKKLEIENMWVTVCLAGMIAGGCYLAVEIILIAPSVERSSSSYGDNGGWIIVDGIHTTYGYIVMMKSTAFFTGLGAISGLAFWKIYKVGNNN